MKLNNTQKIIIKITDFSEYKMFKCELHGIFSSKIENNPRLGICPYCHKHCEDISELAEEIRKTL